MWKGIVAKSFLIEDFKCYVDTIVWGKWKPSMIVLHNTQVPSLADEPNGFNENKMLELQHYYRDIQHWSGGPHLFVTDTLIWVFTPLVVPGVHSPSWNNISLGVEMLGDYDKEDFNSGRGLLVHQNAVQAIAYLLFKLGLDENALRLHREDPETTHKYCPGKNVDKTTIQNEINGYTASAFRVDH